MICVGFSVPLGLPTTREGALLQVTMCEPDRAGVEKQMILVPVCQARGKVVLCTCTSVSHSLPMLQIKFIRLLPDSYSDGSDAQFLNSVILNNFIYSFLTGNQVIPLQDILSL